MLDSIKDKMEEYSYYFTETNDMIKTALDKIQDVFRNGAPKLGGFLK
jgi:hypothetical protein